MSDFSIKSHVENDNHTFKRCHLFKYLNCTLNKCNYLTLF